MTRDTALGKRKTASAVASRFIASVVREAVSCVRDAATLLGVLHRSRGGSRLRTGWGVSRGRAALRPGGSQRRVLTRAELRCSRHAGDEPGTQQHLQDGG